MAVQHRKKIGAARIPLYQEERNTHRLSESMYLRLLVAAVSLFVVTVGVVFFVLFNYLATAHANRLQYQKDTDERLTRLACIAIHGLPDSLGPNVKSIRSTYHCPEPSAATVRRTLGTTAPSKTALGSATGRSHSGGSAPTTSAKPEAAGAAHPSASTRASHSGSSKGNGGSTKPTSHPSTHASSAPPIVTLPGAGKTCQVGLAGICVLG